jgi:hypothetical protein
MKYLLKTFIFSILLPIFFMGNLQATPIPIVVGSIQEFNCISNFYTHIRNGETLPVYFQMRFNHIKEDHIIDSFFKLVF